MTAPTPHAHSIYMREMMEHLGIDPGGGAISRLGLSYAAAFHRCEACPSKQACRAWLDSMPAAAASPALLPECRYLLCIAAPMSPAPGCATCTASHGHFGAEQDRLMRRGLAGN